MSAFDIAVVTIHDEDWGEGEEVAIRELTYGESTKMSKDCTDKSGKLDEHKFADMLLPLAIVSWTFKKDGEDVPVNLETIRGLTQSYVAFIAEKIGEFVGTADEDFPDEA